MIVGSLTKQPAERFPVTVDFTKDLGTGETVSTAVVTSKDALTGADTSATLLDGTPSVVTSKVTQTVKAGASGNDHVVQFRATTSAAMILEAEILVQVRET